ncbi:MAG: hypothetical protein HY904_09820 [Deltaproteobacteria bacterium]|nr:hypothetical protein [Deltaproteobacteria bacterium]
MRGAAVAALGVAAALVAGACGEPCSPPRIDGDWNELDPPDGLDPSQLVIEDDGTGDDARSLGMLWKRHGMYTWERLHVGQLGPFPYVTVNNRIDFWQATHTCNGTWASQTWGCVPPPGAKECTVRYELDSTGDAAIDQLTFQLTVTIETMTVQGDHVVNAADRLVVFRRRR